MREIVGSFHFQLTRKDNIRFSQELGGGSLLDVGCYPVRLAAEVFGTEPYAGSAEGDLVDGVDVDAAGVLIYPGGSRLLLTCGFRRSYDTFTRILGTEGHIHLTNPYHPGPSDTLEVVRSGGEAVIERPTTDQHSFTAALRHIHSVLLDGEPPRQLATEVSLPSALALERLLQSLA